MKKYLLLFCTNPNTIMADQYYKLRFFCTSLTFLCLLTLVSDFRQLYKFILFFLSYLKTIILEQIHGKIKGTVQKVPMYILHSSCIASLVINVCDKSGIFVTTNESTVTHHHHPKSIVNIWVHSRCCTFCVFGQIYHYKCSLPLDSFFLLLFLFFLLNVDGSSFTPIFWKDYLCSIVLLLLFVEYELLICVSACLGTLVYWCICFFFHHYHTVLIAVISWQILKWWTSVQLFSSPSVIMLTILGLLPDINFAVFVNTHKIMCWNFYCDHI